MVALKPLHAILKGFESSHVTGEPLYVPNNTSGERKEILMMIELYISVYQESKTMTMLQKVYEKLKWIMFIFGAGFLIATCIRGVQKLIENLYYEKAMHGV